MSTEYNSLLATDMDYTLLMPGEDVPDENIAAVQALLSEGIAFTIATGRSSYLVGKFAERLQIDVPIITGNGGALFDAAKREHIRTEDFPEQKLRYLLRLMLDNAVDATLYSVSGIYFTPSSTRRFFCDDYNRDVERALKAPLINISASVLEEATIPSFNKFLLINPPAEIEEQLRHDKDLTLVSSGPGFIDVMPAGVSKGKALLELADFLGVPRDMTFAAGDSENDISMLSSARYGICMSNGTPEAKACSSYIAPRCEEMGFARAVYEYVIPIARQRSGRL